MRNVNCFSDWKWRLSEPSMFKIWGIDIVYILIYQVYLRAGLQVCVADGYIESDLILFYFWSQVYIIIVALLYRLRIKEYDKYDFINI